MTPPSWSLPDALHAPVPAVDLHVVGARHVQMVDELHEIGAPSPEYSDILYDDFEEPFTRLWFPDRSVVRIVRDALAPGVADALGRAVPELCARWGTEVVVQVPSGADDLPMPDGPVHEGLLVRGATADDALEPALAPLVGGAAAAAVDGVVRPLPVGSLDELLQRNAAHPVRVRWASEGAGPLLVLTRPAPAVIDLVVPAARLAADEFVDRFGAVVHATVDLVYAGADVDLPGAPRRASAAGEARRWSSEPPRGRHRFEWPR